MMQHFVTRRAAEVEKKRLWMAMALLRMGMRHQQLHNRRSMRQTISMLPLVGRWLQEV
jgi:hypothetical protein